MVGQQLDDCAVEVEHSVGMLDVHAAGCLDAHSVGCLDENSVGWSAGHLVDMSDVWQVVHSVCPWAVVKAYCWVVMKGGASVSELMLENWSSVDCSDIAILIH